MISFMVFCSCGTSRKINTQAYLSRKVNLLIYPQENLESILFRLKTDNDIPIIYSTYSLIGYMAVRRNYQQIRLDSILSDQLRLTPFNYRPDKKQIVIYQRPGVIPKLNRNEN